MNKKLTKYLLALILTAFNLHLASIVHGDALSDVQQQSAAIQTQQQQLNNQLNTQMAVVSQQTVKTNTLKAAILKTQSEIENTQHNLTTQKKLLAQRRSFAAQRLHVLQKQDTQQNLFSAIVSSNSLSDMIRRVYVIKAVQKADAAAIANVSVTYENLSIAKKDLTEKQTKLLQQQVELNAQNSKLQTALTQLKQTMANNQTQLQTLNQQQATLKQQAAQAAADKKAAADQAAADQANQHNAAKSTDTTNNTADQPNQTVTAAANANPTTTLPVSPSISTDSGKVATGVKISFYDPAVLGSSMGYGGVAANLAVYPKGTHLKIVFADGTEIHRVVNDTGTFVYSNPNQIDVAWPNAAIPSYGITTATVTVE